MLSQNLSKIKNISAIAEKNISVLRMLCYWINIIEKEPKL